MISTFLGYQLYGKNLGQSLARVAAQPAVSQAEAYFNANIGKVKTVSDLVNNYRLLSYATQAFGLGDQTNAKALLTKVLTSDLTSSTSVANKLNDSRYTAFARAFNFDTKGNIKSPLQTGAQQSATEALFAAKTNLGATAAAAATKSFETAISAITSVSQLEKNPAALGYVLIAYGIDPDTAPATFEKTLESDLSDPASLVDQQADSGFTALASAFNVASDGSLGAARQAQTADSVTATTNAYLSTVATDGASQKAAAAETSYYTATITGITSVSQLIADKRLVAYVVKAFGLPTTADANSVSQALTSDLSDKKSYANASPAPGYLALAKAFNFTTTGVAAPGPFQYAAQQQSTVQLYLQRQAGDSAAVDAATAYYKANIGNVHSVSDLQNDPALLTYVLKAYGIASSTPASTVAAILTKSTSVDKGVLALAQGFSVNADGSPAATIEAETGANQKKTVAAYLQTVGADAASQKTGTTESNYFLSQISSVTTASALVSDKRLLAFVIKAYGLPPGTTADNVQQALTSDTSDSTSFANTAGSGFATLARAFDFGTSGQAGSVTQLQTDAQLQTITQLYSDRTGATPAAAQAATTYFQNTIGGVKSVADLVADPKLLNYVVTAYGLDPKTSAAAVSAILENTGGIVDRDRNVANAFTVRAGTATQAVAQTADAVSATIDAYESRLSSSAAVQAAATADASSYAAKISQVQSVGDLVADSSLVSFVKTAFGLPSDTTTAKIQQALTSDLSSPTSFANSSDPSYVALAKAFNFSTYGTPQLQTAAQQQSTEQLFASNTSDDSDTAAAETAYYKAAIANVQTTDALQSDPRVLTYLSTAYGVDLTTSPAALTSILDSTHNVFQTSPSSSLLALNQAFNVDASGNATGGLTAQSSADVTATTTAYAATVGSSNAAKSAANAATIYYKSAIAKVTSANDLLADPKLVTYLKAAYAIPASTTTATLYKVLTSDVTNRKSAARTLGTAYQQLAAAFNFAGTGLVTPQVAGAVSKSQLNTINSGYDEQQLETQAAVQNPGIELALYLQVNASKITDAYSILADKKLTTIIHTILQLPATASNADIDAQAKTITSKINLADLKDPKKLQNLIQRFSVLYDLNPPKSTAPLTLTSVLSGGSTDPLDVTSLFSGSTTSQSSSSTQSLVF